MSHSPTRPSDPGTGHLGTFTLSLHWMNLGNQPVEVLIEDVYLLVTPSPQTNVNPAEEEDRKQAAKAERLESAELLHVRGGAEAQSGQPISRYKALLVLIIAAKIPLKPRASYNPSSRRSSITSK